MTLTRDIHRLFKALYYLPSLVLAAPLLRLAAFVKRTINKRRTLVGLTT